MKLSACRNLSFGFRDLGNLGLSFEVQGIGFEVGGLGFKELKEFN